MLKICFLGQILGQNPENAKMVSLKYCRKIKAFVW